MSRFNPCLWYVSILAIGLIAASAPGCGCPQTPPNPPVAPQPEVNDPPRDKTPEDAEAESKPAPDADDPEAQAEPTETPAEPAAEEKSKPQDADSGGASEKPAAPGSGAPGSETKSGGATAGSDGAGGEGAGSGGGAAGGTEAGSPSGNRKGAGGLLGAKQPQRSKGQPKGDPQAARKTGREQLVAANKAAAKGNHAQAFQDAVRGWQAVAPFKNDAECRRLTAELRKRMEKFGAAANTGVSADSSKTLIVE